MSYFIKYNDIVLSTPYETQERATQVKDALAKQRVFTSDKHSLEPSLLSIVEGEVDATKRGHKNVALEDIEADAVRQLKNLQSLIYKAKKNATHEMQEDAFDVANMKAIHGNEWKKYMQDEDGITAKDEERYRYRFKVSKKPTLREIARFTGLNVFQIYKLQEKTKLYPEPKISKNEVNKYITYVKTTGDRFDNGLNFSDDSYLEEYSLSF